MSSCSLGFVIFFHSFCKARAAAREGLVPLGRLRSRSRRWGCGSKPSPLKLKTTRGAPRGSGAREIFRGVCQDAVGAAGGRVPLELPSYVATQPSAFLSLILGVCRARAWPLAEHACLGDTAPSSVTFQSKAGVCRGASSVPVSWEERRGRVDPSPWSPRGDAHPRDRAAMVWERMGTVPVAPGPRLCAMGPRSRALGEDGDGPSSARSPALCHGTTQPCSGRGWGRSQ